jgi:hypothetical protein
MWYEDEDGYIFDADYTYIRLEPAHNNATHGIGYQEDYYSWDTSGRVRSYYRYLWYKFDWEIRDGVLYLSYYDDLNLDTLYATTISTTPTSAATSATATPASA